jgi:hypothetical protein
VLREVTSKSPESIVEEYAALLKSYRVFAIGGDRYAGEWPREAFRKYGIEYRVSLKPKSDLYVDLLPAINSRNIDLLDNSKAINQLCGLERRTARSGRDSIDHAPSAHDDLANVIAGVVGECRKDLSNLMPPPCGPILVGARKRSAAYYSKLPEWAFADEK